jgi:putative two-component system response regulator
LALLEDESRHAHEQMVSEIAGRLALCVWGDREKADIVCEAARLHDVGKNFIPSAILLKPSKLSEQEFEIVKKHTENGFGYLANQIKTLLYAAIIALQHHEREDGTGYDGLTHIHATAKLVAVADVFDALISARSYKKSWSAEKVVKYLEEGRGNQFAAVYVDALLQSLDDILRLYCSRGESL